MNTQFKKVSIILILGTAITQFNCGGFFDCIDEPRSGEGVDQKTNLSA